MAHRGGNGQGGMEGRGKYTYTYIERFSLSFKHRTVQYHTKHVFVSMFSSVIIALAYTDVVSLDLLLRNSIVVVLRFLVIVTG